MRYSNAKSTRRSVQEGSPRYYEWRVPGHPLSVQLNLAVIDRLETDIMKGFWAVPKRGMEVGGLLIGRIESGDETVVLIDDYEPVSCEHRRGPSYVLSEPDRKRLEKALRRTNGGKQVVGFYRSHTRLGLYLDQEDMAVIDGYFGSPNQVFLLVRPDATRPGAAGFFFREEGEMHRQSTYLEFPFSSAEILKRSGAAVEEQAIVEERVPIEKPKEVPAVPSPKPMPQRPAPVVRMGERVRLPKIRWKPVGAIAAALVVFAGLEHGVATYLRRPAAAAAVNFSPSLSVEPNGNYLQVSWDRNALAVLKAERGILSITEGNFRKDLNLDERQLRTGSVVYAPRGNEVNFRLDLLGGRTTVSESVRFLSAPQAAAPVQAVASAPAPAPVVAAPPARQEPPRANPVQAKAKTKRPSFFDDGL